MLKRGLDATDESSSSASPSATRARTEENEDSDEALAGDTVVEPSPEAPAAPAPRKVVLDAMQRYALSKVVCERPQSIILVGAAGVGKSETVRAMRELLHVNGIKHKTTAATGVAAFNVNGVTAHRCFGIPIELFDSVYVLYGNLRTYRTFRKLCPVRVFIVDEFFMLDARVVAMIDTILRCCRDIWLSTGKMQVIPTIEEEAERRRIDTTDCAAMDKLVRERIAEYPRMDGKAIVGVGDPRQFVPIGPKPHPGAASMEGRYPFEWEHFDAVWPRRNIIMLTKLYRQGDDKRFAAALMQLGEGNLMHPEVVRMLARCTMPLSQRPGVPRGVIERYAGIEPVLLYSINADSDAENRLHMNRLPGPTHTFMPRTVGNENFGRRVTARRSEIDSMRQAMVRDAVRMHESYGMIRRPSEFRAGQKAMILCNMNATSASPEVYNGSTGVIERFCTVEEWCSTANPRLDAEMTADNSADGLLAPQVEGALQHPAIFKQVRERSGGRLGDGDDGDAPRPKYDVNRLTALQWAWYEVAGGRAARFDLSCMPPWMNRLVHELRTNNIGCNEPTMARDRAFPVVRLDDNGRRYFCAPHLNVTRFQRAIVVVDFYVPVNACNAITTHKSQGKTMISLEVDMKRMPTNGLYVAASRVTSEHGLYIKNFSPRDATFNQRAIEWMKMIKNSRGDAATSQN